MPRPLHLTGVILLAAGAACSDSSPPSSAPAPGGGESITGRERIGWTQPASSLAELAQYRYALYVDGTRRVLEGETCASESRPGGFDCSAPLPALAPGRRRLELAAFLESTTAPIEGTRSAPLDVTVAGSAAQAPAAPPHGGVVVSSDGIRLQAAILARDLLDPVDLAVAGDRVYTAEKDGRVRSFGGDGRATPMDQNVLEGMRDSEGATLVSLAAAPDFPESRLLYAASVTDDHDGPVLRVTRFREAGGTLGETAVITSLAVTQGASTQVRFGPDRHLYVAIGSGEEPGLAQDLASSAGKIIRLRADGTQPDDNPGPSGVLSLGHRDPRGLAWQGTAQTLWMLDRQDDVEELNQIQPGGNYGAPVVSGLQRYPGALVPVLTIPSGTDMTGLAAITSRSSPFAGDLIASAAGAEDLLRIRIAANGRARVAARLLQGRFGRIRAVQSAGDGSLYFVTGNEDRWGPGRDVLISLSAAELYR